MNLKSYLEELLDGVIRGQYTPDKSTVRRIESVEEFNLITNNGKKSLRGVITVDGLYMVASENIIHIDLLHWMELYDYVDVGRGAQGDFDEDLDKYLTVISHGNTLYIGESYPEIFITKANKPGKLEYKLVNFYANKVSMLGIKFEKGQTAKFRMN